MTVDRQRQAEGIEFAANAARDALDRSLSLTGRRRLRAQIESVMWIAAGWEEAGRPQPADEDALGLNSETRLLGFYWLRNRPVHEVQVLVKDSISFEAGLMPSESLVPGPDLVPRKQALWGSVEAIRVDLTRGDKTFPLAAAAFRAVLERQPIRSTVGAACRDLLAIAGAIRGGA